MKPSVRGLCVWRDWPSCATCVMVSSALVITSDTIIVCDIVFLQDNYCANSQLCCLRAPPDGVHMPRRSNTTTTMAAPIPIAKQQNDEKQIGFTGVVACRNRDSCRQLPISDDSSNISYDNYIGAKTLPMGGSHNSVYGIFHQQIVLPTKGGKRAVREALIDERFGERYIMAPALIARYNNNTESRTKRTEHVTGISG